MKALFGARQSATAGPPAAGGSSLLHDPAFVRFWGGQSAGVLASQVSGLAVPLTAVTLLGASPFEMGMLAGVGGLPAVLISLPAGVLVDRLPLRALLVISSLALALTLAVIPMAAHLGVLSMPVLYPIALILGCAAIISTIAQQSTVATIVRPDQLLDANSKLESSRAMAGTTGPAVAGALIDTLSPAPALLLNSAIHMLSSGLFALTDPVRPAATATTSAIQEARDGLRFVADHAELRTILVTMASWNIFSAMSVAMLVLFATRELGLGATALGFIFIAANLGSLVGSMIARPTAERFGAGKVLVGAIVLGGACVSVSSFATLGSALVLLFAAWFGRAVCVVVFNVNQVSFRQQIAPPNMQGRVHATAIFIALGTWPLGGLLGGVTAEAIGVPSTILLSGALMSLAAAWIIRSPLIDLVRIEDKVAVADR